MPLIFGGFLKKISKVTSTKLKVKKEMDVSLVFVGEMRMKKLNAIYRGQDEVTDVLSFGEVNEIVICFKQAKRQATSSDTSIKQEVGFLFSHGLLHLLGYTHNTGSKYKKMIGLQEDILKKSLKS